jgi:hypothetical protein
MTEVQRTFKERSKEIELYFTFVEEMLTTPGSRKSSEINKILKSNLILMLYNLVESTVTNSIERIHTYIYENKTSFDTLKIGIKKILLKQIKNNDSPHHFVTSISNIALDIVKCSFLKHKISNGNIDNETISRLGKEYGFNIKTDYSKTKGGKCLTDIRGKRNDLAHGVFSFAEVGKEYTLVDVEIMKNETISYLDDILKNIQIYLDNKDFKA